MSGRVVRSSQHTKKTGSSGSSESSSQSDFSMGQRIPDRIQFIRNFPANRRFAQLAMEAGDESHIVHHEHDDDDSEDRCTDVKCILQKKTKNFDAIICQIGGTLEYIKSGTTGHTLKGSVVEENLNYAMKVVAYPKKDHYPDPNNIERPENAELLMIRLLSKLVVDIKTPHIILPIGTFDIDLSQFIASTRNKIIDCDRYDAFIERFQKNEFYPKASVLLSEWADRGDLLDYIRSNYHTMTEMDWRVIFFKFYSALLPFMRSTLIFVTMMQRPITGCAEAHPSNVEQPFTVIRTWATATMLYRTSASSSVYGILILPAFRGMLTTPRLQARAPIRSTSNRNVISTTTYTSFLIRSAVRRSFRNCTHRQKFRSRLRTL